MSLDAMAWAKEARIGCAEARFLLVCLADQVVEQVAGGWRAIASMDTLTEATSLPAHGVGWHLDSLAREGWLTEGDGEFTLHRTPWRGERS